MLISVIIPFKNSASTLSRCLEALACQKYRAADYIFVDSNSRDGSPEIINDFAARHPEMCIKLLNENRGTPGKARNRGSKESSGQWFAFTDSDCIPDPDWLSDLVAVINGESEKTGAVAGCIRAAESVSVVARFLGLYTLPPVTVGRYVDAYTLVDGGFPTANLTVRRSVFESIEGFDDSFIGGEDHDLCRRIYAAGYRVKLVTNARTRHIHRETVSKLLKQAYGYGTFHPLLLKTMPHGAVIIQMPFCDMLKMDNGWRVWLDLNQADKKMLVAVILPFLWLPLVLLPFAYLIYLAYSIRGKMSDWQPSSGVGDAFAMAVLLLMKSFALTCGRVRGSVRYGVLCV